MNKRAPRLNSVSRRKLLLFGAAWLSLNGSLLLRRQDITDDAVDSLESDLSRGRAFLSSMIDPELDLLPEYLGSNVYWLYHDNYLATKILKHSHPRISHKIEIAIQREGVSESGKIELLFGELNNPLPFRQHDLVDVRRIGQKTIRTEVTKSVAEAGWQGYADLRLMACVAESRRVDARKHWDVAMRMWNGTGFVDHATNELRRYSTYKLSLALIAANHLDLHPPKGVTRRLRSLQSKSGGWVTDYGVDGEPIGLVNTETTCLSILGLERYYTHHR